MADDKAVTSLSFDARGAKQGADDFAAASQKIIDANRQVEAAETKAADTVERAAARKVAARRAAAAVDAGKKEALDAATNAGILAAAIDKTVAPLQRQESLLNRVARAVDPLGLAAQKASKDVDALTRIIEAGGPNAERALGLITGATQRLDDSIRALNATASDARFAQLAEKFDPVGASARRMTAELAELNEAFNAGVNIAGGYTAAFERIVSGYNEADVAARRLAAAQAELIASARAEQNAANAQGAFNAQLGVRPSTGAQDRARFGSALQDLAELEDQIDAASASAAARVQLLTEKFDPAAASAKRMAGELAELNEAQRLGVTIAGGYESAFARITEKYDEGTQAAKRAAAAQADLIDRARAEQLAANSQQAFNRVLNVNPQSGAGSAAASAQVFIEAAAAEKEAAAEQDRLTASAQKYRDQINPLLPLQRAYAAEVAEINRLTAAGKLSTDETAAALVVARTNFTRAASATDDHAKAMGRGTVSAQQMHFALQNLTFQVNDVATSLASGISPARTFAQQAGQFVQVFQQGGGVSNMLTAAGTAIRSWITPTTAAIAGVATLAVGVGVLIAKAVELDSRTRTLNVALSGMGTASLVSSAGLERSIKELRDYGLAADEAQAAVLKIARTPGINPAATTRLAETGADLGAIRGTGTDAGVSELIQTLQQGPEAIINLGVELRKISPDEAKHIRDLKDQAGAVVAADAAYKLLSDRLGGTYKSTLSDSAKAWIDLKNATNDFLTDIAKSGVIQDFLKDLREMVSSIQSVATFLNGLRGSGASGAISGAINSVTTAGDAATQQALKNRAEMDAALVERSGGTAGSGPLNPNVGDVVGAGAGLSALQRERRLRDLAAQGGMPGMPSTSDIQQASALDRAFTARLAPNVTASSSFRSASAADAGFATPAPTGQSVFTPTDPTKINETNKAIHDLNITSAQQIEIAKQTGIEQQALSAYYAEYNKALAETGDISQAMARGNVAMNAARQQSITTLQKEAETQRIANELGLATAKAYGTDVVAGYRAAAQAEAELAVRAGQATDAAAKTQEILRTQAVAAIQAGAQQIAAAQPQIVAAEKLADATKRGTAAAHEQDLQNQAAAQTQDALAKAEATRNPALIAQAKALNDAALAEVKRRDAAEQSRQTFAAINQRNDQIAVTQLQTGLVGQTPEAVAAATAHMQEQQRLLNVGVDLSSEIAKASLANVDALSRANVQYAEAVREQQRLEDGIRSVVDTINNDLTKGIEDAFSGAKVESWGQRIKTMLGSLVSSISSSLFLKPLTGTLLSAVGLGNLGAQYGTFSGLGSLFGGGGASGGSGSITVTPNSDGTFSLSNLSNAASLGKSLFGGSGDSLFGSTSSFFSGIGTNLGFATSVPGLSASEISSLGNLIGIEPSSLGYLGTAGTIPGSLFGNMTLGSAFSSIGAGFGAGSLLNSLIGGNKIFGTIGSGLGSTAGSLIPSALGMSLGPLGGIAGGLLGGLLGGLFGPPPTVGPNSTAGLSVTDGKLTVSSSLADNGGDASESGRLAKTVATAVNSFLSTYGGTYGGTGFAADIGRFDSKGGYFANGVSYGSDATAAQNALELELARSANIQGYSDTMRTVLQKSDAEDLSGLSTDAAFARTYDKIKTAADDAFASIASDLDQTGPFAQAKDQIKTIFDGITASAQKFGLSLDPVNAALDEANRRLTEDFNRSITDAINAIVDPVQAQIDAEKRLGDQRIKEAEAVGGDLAQVDRLNALEMKKITDAQAAATKSLADQIEGVFSSVAGEINQAGPFAKVKDQLDAIYANADQFGLSLEAVSAAIADANKRLTADFNRSIQDQISAAETPLQSLVDLEKRAGQQRLSDAIAVNGNIVEVNRLNADKLTAIWTDQTKSLSALADEFRYGDLSGLTSAQRLSHANDNYATALASVRAGSGQFDDLVTAARNVYDLSTSAYGQGPKTVGLRTDILSAIDSVLASRSFARGTDATPPGWIRVGEQGPEWMYQRGGATVLPNGQNPGGADGREMAGLLRELLVEMRANTGTTRAGLYETVRQLRAQMIEMQRKPLYEPPRRAA